MPSLSLAASVCVVAALTALTTNAAVLIAGQSYFTQMLGGKATTDALKQYGKSFVATGNHNGDQLASPQCILTHDRVTVSRLDFTTNDITQTPTLAGATTSSIYSQITGVTAELSMARFEVRCTFPQPFNGNVDVELKIRGNASFAWSGALTWMHPLKVGDGSVLVQPSTMEGQIGLSVAYQYENNSPFLFDLYTSEWFQLRAASLSTQFQTYLDGMSSHYFHGLIQTALTPLTNLEANSTCSIVVGGAFLNITSGSTCQTGIQPQFPGLQPSTVQILQTTQSGDVHVKGKDNIVCQACAVAQCGFVFPPNYQVTSTGQYCQLQGTQNSANLFAITQVVIA